MKWLYPIHELDRDEECVCVREKEALEKNKDMPHKFDMFLSSSTSSFEYEFLLFI